MIYLWTSVFGISFRTLFISLIKNTGYKYLPHKQLLNTLLCTFKQLHLLMILIQLYLALFNLLSLRHWLLKRPVFFLFELSNLKNGREMLWSCLKARDSIRKGYKPFCLSFLSYVLVLGFRSSCILILCWEFIR